MKRVFVYVDGFNLYHAVDDLGINSLKWLDLWSLSEKLISAQETVNQVYYFSAYAKWIEPAYRRHQKYVAALRQSGVTPIVGRFKEKKVRCKAKCGMDFITHEEKETDVNIGVHLVADAIEEKFDRALIISADTDLIPAVRLALFRSNNRRIHIVAPPGRLSRNREHPPLFEITRGKVRQSLFPAEIPLADGGVIRRPRKYDPA